MDLISLQEAVCRRYAVAPAFVGRHDMLGVSRSIQVPMWPIMGIRNPPAGGTSGWFVWTGQKTDADDFFVPKHAAHVIDSRPVFAAYLGLPPGWGFVVAPDYEDVWQDDRFLNG